MQFVCSIANGASSAVCHRDDAGTFGVGKRAFHRRRVTLPAGQLELRALTASAVDAVVACSTGHIAAKRPFIVDSFGRRNVVGAFCDGSMAGYMVWDRAFFARPFVWLLGVKPAFRRHGVASCLLREFAGNCPGEALFTSTNESNAAMHALLRECGYVRCGKVENLDPGDPEIFFFKAPAAT